MDAMRKMRAFGVRLWVAVQNASLFVLEPAETPVHIVHTVRVVHTVHAVGPRTPFRRHTHKNLPQVANFFASATRTQSGTNASTFPPRRAISLTIRELI